jgi:hypothetical protein
MMSEGFVRRLLELLQISANALQHELQKKGCLIDHDSLLQNCRLFYLLELIECNTEFDYDRNAQMLCIFK